MESVRSSEPIVKYVGHKVSCLRWKPQPAGAIECSDVFVSGSYDDESNRVCAWQFDPDDRPETTADVLEPQLVCEVKVDSEVTDIRFLDGQRVVASLSNGCVALFAYQDTLKFLKMSECLHHIRGEVPAVNPLPCTVMSVCGSGGVGLVTGGEDGRINVLGMDSLQPIRTIDLADNAVITSLACTMQLEVLSTSSSGQLKLWDLRSRLETPSKTIVVSGEYVSLQSMDRHPHQPHLIALGRGDGSVCFMDLRQEKAPVPTIVQAHSSDVWEVKFHPSYPNNLFTCSHDGSLWHWDATSSTVSSTTTQLPPSSSVSSRPSSTTPLRTHTSFLSSKPNTSRLQTTNDSFLSHSTPLYQHQHQHQRPHLRGVAAAGLSTTTSNKASNFVSATSPIVSTHLLHPGEVSCLATTTDSSPWLSGVVQQGKVEVVNFSPRSTLSVNCLDIESRHLVCGTDSESIMVVPNLTLT